MATLELSTKIFFTDVVAEKTPNLLLFFLGLLY